MVCEAFGCAGHEAASMPRPSRVSPVAQPQRSGSEKNAKPLDSPAPRRAASTPMKRVPHHRIATVHNRAGNFHLGTLAPVHRLMASTPGCRVGAHARRAGAHGSSGRAHRLPVGLHDGRVGAHRLPVSTHAKPVGLHEPSVGPNGASVGVPGRPGSPNPMSV